jgi:hypothetical protein
MYKYTDFPNEKREYYENMLKIVGSLSRLFSENDIPYLDSRVAENIYCKSFNANNKSRDDSSIDAVYKKVGIGIKTFAGNGAQKVAEFNKDVLIFSNLPALQKAKKISELRNKRIQATKVIYGIDEAHYHCIRREKGKMILCESNMDLIDISRLEIASDNTAKSIKFNDGINSYIFNISKSVLLKQFPKNDIVSEIEIEILEDPFNILDKALSIHKKELLKAMGEEHQFVILPLYSVVKDKKVVPKRSGLNQWNASGRKRGKDELYIPIPAWVHSKFPNFFPDRETKFKLKLPNGNIISAKVCQDNDKALMSDPNEALGKWVLRDILQLRTDKLVTYKMLQEIGIDSVIVKKTGVEEYSIDFREEGEFEKFKEENLANN